MIACHPRVAQLRGYPSPSKPSLPQECVQITPKVCRSNNARGASADLNQLAGWLSPKPAKNAFNPAPQAGLTSHRTPFRNVQNWDKLNYDVPLAVLKTNESARSLPTLPTDIITGSGQLPSPTAKINAAGTFPTTPISTTFFPNAAVPVQSALPESTSRARFPSGFIDAVHGYSKMTDYSHDNCTRKADFEDDHPPSYPRPVSRRGLYRSSIDSYSDSSYTNIYTSAFYRAGDVGLENGGDQDMEESDIGEASPLEFDMEEDEMQRELIKMLDV